MNAREHADMAAHLSEQAAIATDEEQRRRAVELGNLATSHALTSIALSLAAAVDRADLAELMGRPA